MLCSSGIGVEFDTLVMPMMPPRLQLNPMENPMELTVAKAPSSPIICARHLVGMAIVALAGPVLAAPANYAYCILDKAPKAQNDVAAGAVHEVCIADHPGGLEAVKQGSGRDMVFGYKSGPACVAAKGQDTRSIRAAQLVSAACRRLYDESDIDRFLDGAPSR